MWQFIYIKRFVFFVVVLIVLGVCDENFDLDFCDLGGGNLFDILVVVLNLLDCLCFDVNGVIIYLIYQVVVVCCDDIFVIVVGWIGIDVQVLVDYNVILIDIVLCVGEVLVVLNGIIGIIGGILVIDQVDVIMLVLNVIDCVILQ